MYAHFIPTKTDVVLQCPLVESVIVYQRTGDIEVPFHPKRDVWWHEAVKKFRPYCPCEPMDAEDALFMLYTSGSTGAPKGLLHTCAGYLLGVLLTTRYVFNLQPGDRFGCRYSTMRAI